VYAARKVLKRRSGSFAQEGNVLMRRMMPSGHTIGVAVQVNGGSYMV